MHGALLDGVRVVEICDGVAGAYCGKVLAELGADVIKVEAPGRGDPARHVGPFIGCEPHAERSGSFIYLNTGKRSVTVAGDSPSGQTILSQLVGTAQILLVDGLTPPAPIPDGWDGIAAHFVPSLHPERAGYARSDLTAYALGGYLYVDGAPDRPPLRGGGPQPAHAAANYGLLAILAARYADRGKPRQRTILVPEAECMATMHWYTTVMWTYAGIKKRRIGSRLDIAHPVSLYPCRDGWVAIGAGGDRAWRMLVIGMGQPELADDPRYADAWSRLQRADEVDALITEFTSTRQRQEVMETLQQLRVPCGYVSTPQDLLRDPQYQERNYWQTVEQDGVGALRMPGWPFQASNLAFVQRPAPQLGQHTVEVLSELGWSAEDIRRLRGEHVI